MDYSKLALGTQDVVRKRPQMSGVTKLELKLRLSVGSAVLADPK